MKYSLSLFLLLVSIGLWSCGSSPPAYVPNKMHMPFFDQAGQLYAEASVTATSSYDVALAGSITDHLVIEGVTTVHLEPTLDTAQELYNLEYYQLGAGWQNRIGKRSFWEVVASVGHGTTSAQGYNTFFKNSLAPFKSEDITDTFLYVHAKYNRYSIEGHIGVSTLPASEREQTNVYLEYGTGVRISYLIFSELNQRRRYVHKGEYILPDSLDLPVVTSESTTINNPLFFEYVLMGRLNYYRFGIEAQVGLSISGDDDFTSHHSILTLGIFYRL